MPPIHIMLKPMSGACNLRCRYCFYADEVAHRAAASCGIMSEATARTLIRKAFLYADDAVTFSFQGGEPTLAGLDFFRMFVKTVGEHNTRRLRVDYSLQTNATLLDDAFCAFFREQGFLVGVSLDGTAETHDAQRVDYSGGGTHETVLRGIALLQKHHVEFNILCVVTRAVADDLQKVWRALARFGHIQFIPCIDGLDGEPTDASLDAARYGKMLVETFDLYRAAFFSAAPVRERRMDNYLSMLLGYPPEACGMTGACGVYFLCEADGSVYPCDFYALDKWKLGSICDSSFARLADSETMRRFQEEGRRRPAACADCRYFPLCRGGCRRDREPSLDANRFCESYRYFFDRRLDAMLALAREVQKGR